MTLRLALIRLTFAAAICAGFSGQTHAQSSADLLIRIDQLEGHVRQLTGQIEQMQYRNQQLEAALKRMQEDVEFRFQEISGAKGAAPRAPNRPVAAAPMAPAAGGPPPVPGRRSDAFDPNENPNAVGVPRVLGSTTYAGASRGEASMGTPVIMAEDPNAGSRAPGAPLDLSAMSAAAVNDPTLTARLGQAGPGQAGPGQAGGLPPARAPSATGAYATATAPPTQTARDSFDLGYGYIQRRDYELAEETFRDFLRRYPGDRLSGDAQYYLGESFYLRQSYREAADAFLALSKKYEASPKAPEGLLRLGESLAALNEKELACATFGEVVRKYPRASSGVKQAVDREQKRARC